MKRDFLQRETRGSDGDKGDRWLGATGTQQVTWKR